MIGTSYEFRRIVLASLLTFVATSGSAEAGLRAGAARRSIVPPFAVHMGGFQARTDKFKGVHDEVYVRALVLENGGTKLVFIGSDLTSVDADMTRQIRERIEKKTGIPSTNILVCCAHNHSAPSIFEPGRFKESELPIKKFFVERFTEAAVEAHRKRVPARAGFRAGQLKGATGNRQQGNDRIDPQVGVLRVEERETRKTIATLFNFTAHPVILGGNNLLLSGEYPGVACRAVENLNGGVAIFTQGAAGDVTIHRSGDPFLEIERVGRTLAGEVIKTSGFIRGSENVPLAAASRTLNLARRNFLTLEAAEKALALAKADLVTAKKRSANRQFQRAIGQRIQLHSINVLIARGQKQGRYLFPEKFQAEVQVLRIGDLIIVTMPGEMFVEYALEMRARVRQSAAKSMILCGYANGYIGYIVTPRAAQTGGYEASVARVSPKSGRLLTEAAMELVGEVESVAGN